MLFDADDEASPKPLYITLYSELKKEILYTSPHDQPEGHFSIVGKGKHRLCVYNGIGMNEVDGDQRAPDGYQRTVAFSIHVRPFYQTQDSIGAEEEAIANSLELVAQLGDNMLRLLDHVEYLKEQAELHKNLADNTLRLLVRWTLLEAVVLTGIAVTQVYYFRKFFETKRYL